MDNASGMFSLDCVGTHMEGILFCDDCFPTRRVGRDVVMVIKAPHGQAVIFKPEGDPLLHDLYELPARAVRAFMEQHTQGNGAIH